jgi:predicted amidohydrolase
MDCCRDAIHLVPTMIGEVKLMTYLRTAVIQLNSRNHVAENMSVVEQSLDRAAMMGAQFVALPEYWTYLGPYTGFEDAAQTLTGPAITLLQDDCAWWKYCREASHACG